VRSKHKVDNISGGSVIRHYSKVFTKKTIIHLNCCRHSKSNAGSENL